MKVIILVLFLVSSAMAVAAQANPANTALDLKRFVGTPDKEDSNNKTEPVANAKPPAKASPYEEPGDSYTEVSIEASRQNLSNGFGEWSEASLNVIHRFSKRKVIYGSYVESKRFDQRDRQAQVGFYQPLDERWTLLVEASASPTHRVLPKWSAMAQLERNFGNGWIGSAGFRRTEHSSAGVNIAKVGVEKYWGHNRASYSASIINLQDTGTTASQRIQYSRYYGDGTSSVGVGFTAGREVEDIGANRILQSDIYNVSVNGKHWFTKHVGADYGFTFHKQGDVYNRRGVRIGLRFKF